jgi:hypothetical protein
LNAREKAPPFLSVKLNVRTIQNMKLKRIFGFPISILACGVAANLAGCRSPITNTLLHHCEPRIEVPGSVHRAVQDNDRIYVQYDAVTTPVSHSGFILSRHSRWMQVSNVYANPLAEWKYQKTLDGSIDTDAAVDIPVKSDIPGNAREADFTNEQSSYVIYGRDDYAEGFSLFIKTGVGTDLKKVHLYNVHHVPAPAWRYPAYLLVPFTVLYDAITIPFWIKDTILFNDT